MIEFLTPVSKTVIAHREVLPNGVLGKNIRVHANTGELPDLKNVLFTPVDGQPCGFDAKDIKLRDLGDGTYEVTFIPWVKLEGLKTKCICYLSFKDGDSEPTSILPKKGYVYSFPSNLYKTSEG